jgi:hypothetical protein
LIETHPIVQELEWLAATFDLDVLQCFAHVAQVMWMHERFQWPFEIDHEMFLEWLHHIRETFAQVVRVEFSKRIRHEGNADQIVFKFKLL